MLRFDLPPVWSNAARLDAGMTFLICLIALAGWPYLMPLLIAMGFVRGFLRHGYCPSHRLHVFLLQKMGVAGKKENAGAKMFANKLLFLASLVASILWLNGSALWMVPTGVLLVFSFLEASVSFCAACWAYSFWYQLRSKAN